jgi:hypothetical protein
MRFSIISVLTAALHLVGASTLPRSTALEYSALQGVEPFNKTFAEAHMATLQGPAVEPLAVSTSGLTARASSGNVYVCINAPFQPACTLIHWDNNQCGKSC